MNDIVFKKIEQIAKSVKADLRRKGLVIPIDNEDGSVTVDTFTITKEATGFYAIKDRFNEIVVANINLPQTAALLANSLALGKWLDSNLVRQDRIYGYKLFEEQLFKAHADKNLKRNNIDKADFDYTKANIAKHKKIKAKEEILRSFDKLRKMR